MRIRRCAEESIHEAYDADPELRLVLGFRVSIREAGRETAPVGWLGGEVMSWNTFGLQVIWGCIKTNLAIFGGWTSIYQLFGVH